MKTPARAARCLLFLAAVAAGELPVRGDEEAAAPPWSGTLTLGAETRYWLHGYSFDRALYLADVYLHRPLRHGWSLWGGGWYGAFDDDRYREGDLYAGAEWASASGWTLGAGYAWFRYLEAWFTTERDEHEYTAYVTRAAGNWTLTLRDHYTREAAGHLVRAIAARNIALPAGVTASVTGEYGYAARYYVTANGSHHALAKLALTRPLGDRLSVTAFVARGFALKLIDDFEKDVTFGGLALSWSFAP